MKIVIAGASGMLGQALVSFLAAQGHASTRLVRRAPRDSAEIFWNPAEGELDAAKLEGVDAVINLSGENIADGRWSPAKRARSRGSRVDATRTLVGAIGRMPRKPAVLINASAVGFYGDRGDGVLTEDSSAGRGFLADVVSAWEAEAARCDVREVRLRFGVLLSPRGGALKKMLPMFRLGLAGPLGTGRQWFSWISLDDAVGVVGHVLADDRVRGPVNAVAPELVTNATFTTALAKALHRPAVCRVPAWALRAAFGTMADETMLASARVEPARLTASGHKFRFPQLAGAFHHLLTAES